jgi:predicted nuclease of predicted toxin-antitoxin system
VKVLFDHNVPKKLRSLLPRHEVSTSRELGWDALKNGELLAAAEANGFQVMVTGDKNLSYQQNFKDRKLSPVVLGSTDWNTVKEHGGQVAAALDVATPGSFKALVFERRRSRGRTRKLES